MTADKTIETTVDSPDHYDGMTLVQFIANLTACYQNIPAEYRDEAVIMPPDRGYGGSDFEVRYTRPETAEETAARLAQLERSRAAELDRVRRQYEALLKAENERYRK